MSQRITFSFITVLLLIALSWFYYYNADDNRIYQRESSYDYNETLLNLDIAISEHNYRIIHRSNIGQAIRDRGDTSFPLSTIINFCNITYAKEMIEISHDLINDMPCFIAVREQGSKVIISTKLMKQSSHNKAQRNFANKINQNLIDIIDLSVE